MAPTPAEEKDLERGLSQNQGEKYGLEQKDEPKQYLEVPVDVRRRPSRRSTDQSVHHDLEKVASAATTIGTQASEFTEATEITTTPSRPLEPERRPWHHR